MSESKSLELSAEDLMPNWASGLEDAPSQPSLVTKYDDSRDQRKGKQGGDRGGRKFDRGGFGGEKRREGGRGGNDRRGQNRGGNDRRRENRPPMRAEDIVPELDFMAEPTDDAVKALAKHIRSTNRAYAMEEVAQMVLSAADRYQVTFRVKSTKKKTDRKDEVPVKASRAFRMVRCKTDGSLWLSREEAVAHFLNTPELLEKFYQVEEVDTGTPKGNFSVIAVCGLSGTILGPPNHHQYQQNINQLHRSRFANMPLDRFKSRIEMRRDEETLEQWKEQMSKSRHYRVKVEKPKSPAIEKKEEEPASGDKEVAAEESTVTAKAEKANEQGAVVDEVAQELVEETQASEAEKTEPVEAPAVEAVEADEVLVSEEGGSAEPAAEEPDKQELVITSMADLIIHFRENFARRNFKEVGEARLLGSASKGELSPALNERMKAEVNWQKRGFPLPMIRSLCRKFEHQGLKFFKRGEKSLFVSAAQARALAAETVLSDRLVLMLNHVKENPGTLAKNLIAYLSGDSKSAAAEASPKKGSDDSSKAPEAMSEPSKEELALLADLRWLLAEGYLIEFQNSELFAGDAMTVNKRKRRPAKRSKKKKVESGKKPETSAVVSSKVAVIEQAPTPTPVVENKKSDKTES